MKEELRPAICMKGEEAIALLARWLSWAARGQIPPFVALGAKIRRHRKNAAACLLSSSVYRRWPLLFPMSLSSSSSCWLEVSGHKGEVQSEAITAVPLRGCESSPSIHPGRRGRC